MKLHALRNKWKTLVKLHLVIVFALFATAFNVAVVHARVIVSQQQGFDTCAAPSISQMQKWWDNSPYFNTVAYIGGSSRGCAQANLNGNWVSTVHSQGWNFMPTWVGPQAPCTNYASRFGYNNAYNAGVAEADKAITAATNLNFTSPLIIYYDMEGYPDNTRCYNAVNAFMNGWGARLRQRGHYSGGYGSACASGVEGWGNIVNYPHSVWMAHWIYGSYNANANVWNVACVPNSYWANSQRIRQYAGDHNETYGGVTINIDSNALDGMVQGSNQHPAGLTDGLGDTDLSSRPSISLNDQTGIVKKDGRTLVSPDGGQTWSEMKPPLEGVVQAASFINAQQGWLATTGFPDDEGKVALFASSTSDGGANWETAFVHTFRLDDGDIIGGPVWVDFVDAQHGWIVVKLATGNNFSRGVLFRTTDGGRTWNQVTLPIGAAVRFIDAETGWTAGGAGGGELYVTRDGGRTWKSQHRVGANDARLFYDLPTFFNSREGVLPVTVASGDKPHIDFYVTTNGGRSWKQAKSIALDGEPGALVPTAIADANRWIIADPAAGAVKIVGGKSDLSGSAVNYPADISALHFENAALGWIETASTKCSGNKTLNGEPSDFRCTTSRSLQRTTNGGQTWIDITP